MEGETEIGAHRYRWQHWQGEQLRPFFALDCETELITGPTVPRLVLCSASDGQQHFIIPPRALPTFLRQHLPTGRVIFHNCGFDFWVLDRYLREASATSARDWLWSAADRGRIHDSMLLAALVGIGEADNMLLLTGGNAGASPQLPSLAALTSHLLKAELPKDQYRLEFDSIGPDWNAADPEFFSYAVRDAIATYRLYCHISMRAKLLTDRYRCSTAYGLLTETIQVKALIALDLLYHRGIDVDTDRAAELTQQLERDSEAAALEMIGCNPALFHRYRSQKRIGELRRNKQGQLQLNTGQLQGHLEEVAAQHSLSIPQTSKGISTSIGEYWHRHTALHPVIDAYCRYRNAQKQRSFVAELPQRIHPRYHVLTRSGRTSCSSPNLQQFDKRVRDVIYAGQGSLLLVVDYSSLELRTLAATCESMFGFSKLGELIRSGTDAHKYLAAQIAGCTLEAFENLPDKKNRRQAAKAANFGLPTGLGVETFIKSSAAPPYRVNLSVPEAQQVIAKWKEAFPEMQLYLQQNGLRRETAVTLTGRVRADLPFCSARNYPFQGLAGDGCKLALWELMKAGFVVRGFIHDEFIIQLHSSNASKEVAEQVVSICCAAMQQVCGTVPIACEYALTYRWIKGAEAVYDESGELLEWRPECKT